MIAILAPVLGRPQRAQPLADSVAAATGCPHRLVFLCSPGDREQVAACRATGADVVVMDADPRPGDYARKMNAGYRATGEPFVFLAADDLRFHDGWDAEALEVADAADAGVVGTNDLGNPTVVAGRHSTHSLVARCYVEALGGTADQGPGVMLFEGYWHNWVDNELVGVAQARGCYRHAPLARVEHLHPVWRKGSDDATYRRGQQNFNVDRRLFLRRQRLWA